MPRTVMRTEELPDIIMTKTWAGLTTVLGSTTMITLIPAGTHPRMRLIDAYITTTIAGT